jgi:hypothetical protein
LYRFQCINTVTFDHPDPSIYCVLASPTAVPGTSNIELGCFPPRWSVAEHTFRPPPFHRNVASEFLGLIAGEYIGKSDAFVPGSASMHNCMSGHGPDASAYQRGREADLKPTYLDNTLVFLFETQLPIRPTRFALESAPASLALWPHPFALELAATVGGTRLDVELTVVNTGSDPIAFAAALHTYLRVSDARRARLSGLREAIDVPIDRVFFGAPAVTRLDEGGRSVRFVQRGFADTVVWNPGPEGARGMPDMAPEGWLEMLCVEAAAVEPPVQLAPGARWSGAQAILLQP